MPTRLETLFANRFVHRVLYKTAFAACLVLGAGCTAVQALRPTDAPAPAAPAWEWPAQWNGATLRPLALTPVEQRFARQFPGQLARLTDGRQVLVLRHVEAPTRMLHPAADCYRALGYRLHDIRLEQDAAGGRQRCFLATRADGRSLRVCEHIEDAQGQVFTDTSAWYWAAVRGRSAGPWLAVTTAVPAGALL